MPEPQIITDLFAEMERTITAYGPGTLKIDDRISGTAFFPGGIGLWRGLSSNSPAPTALPSTSVMILGHNFDKVSAFKASCRRGIELMEGGTWLILRRYLEAAEVRPEDCFFTNIYVGLQPVTSRGEMEASELYKEQCRAFLHYQIEKTQPRLVAILGIPAAEQFHLSGCGAPHVELNHPSYAFQCGRDGKKCAGIVAENARRLRTALESHCQPESKAI